jgi:hypothetical protein
MQYQYRNFHLKGLRMQRKLSAILSSSEPRLLLKQSLCTPLSFLCILSVSHGVFVAIFRGYGTTSFA